MTTSTVARLHCPKGCGRTTPAPPFPQEMTHPCPKWQYRHVVFVDDDGNPAALPAKEPKKPPSGKDLW